MRTVTVRISCCLIVACSAVAVGCTRHADPEIAASAAADARPDGSIVDRESTAAERTSLKGTVEKHETVDAQYPRPQPPYGVPTQKVVRVSVPGLIQLEGEHTVRMDGIVCDEQAISYLRRLLLDETVSVVVTPSAANLGEPTPADVWTVDSFLQTKDSNAPLSYSNPIETAITSGWCAVEATATCKHNDRYAALARAFQSGNATH